MKKNKEVKLVSMPAGFILGMCKKMAEDRGMQKPITWENLTRERDRYFARAAILN
jgi:hypothetical protein